MAARSTKTTTKRRKVDRRKPCQSSGWSMSCCERGLNIRHGILHSLRRSLAHLTPWKRPDLVLSKVASPHRPNVLRDKPLACPLCELPLRSGGGEVGPLFNLLKRLFRIAMIIIQQTRDGNFDLRAAHVDYPALARQSFNPTEILLAKL